MAKVTEQEIKNIVAKVLGELQKNTAPANAFDDGEMLPDLAAVDLRAQLLVPAPENARAYLELKKKTPARVGCWRSGPRYKTETLLRFRADHAAAQDAVFTDVSDQLLRDLNLFTIQTKCSDKAEYLTRPDLGKEFSADQLKILKEKCLMNPEVQVYLADGLSSSAVEANARDILPALLQGLKTHNIKTGTPFFVRYARVPAMEQIAETLGAKVIIALIGERPGLATAKSMSAYIAYDARVGMPEAGRTVISNIHIDGMAAVEAGAHIADLAAKMLSQKASGLDFSATA